MDKVGEAIGLGKRHAISTASSNGKLHQPVTRAKRSVNGVRVVRAGGRKDRHSKVCTAGGTRDRRVRLSPRTAILFYDLQDRLGYDRPSKAIDWLMKEAKAAIDALGDHPPAAAATNVQQSNGGNLIQEHSNDDSGFGLFNGWGAAPPSISGEAYQEQLLSPLELFDANSDFVRLQRIFSWNHADGAAGEDYSSSAPLHYPAAAADFAEREPLQSSYSRINSNYYPQFGFSDQELPNFRGAATFKDDDNINPVLSKSFLPTVKG